MRAQAEVLPMALGKEQRRLKKRQQLVCRLIRANYEMLHKQFLLTDVFGQEFQILENSNDELFAVMSAIELMLEAQIEQSEIVRSHLEELLLYRFMDEYALTPANQRFKLIALLADKFTQLISELAGSLTRPWEEGGEAQFFAVINAYFSDGGCEYFCRAFAHYFTNPKPLRCN